MSGDVCGPATPGSPFELPGLGSSAFARHYSRNHGCFLLLRVLRWFTSPGSLRATMNSSRDTWCSHQAGSPIRISPDHRLCASPRSFSQLATSFIAFLRLGIPTHALSSLTIKLISNTEVVSGQWPAVSRTTPGTFQLPPVCARPPYIRFTAGHATCVVARQYSVFKELLVVVPTGRCSASWLTTGHWPLATSCWWAWVDSNYRPHPYQGCALTT